LLFLCYVVSITNSSLVVAEKTLVASL